MNKRSFKQPNMILKASACALLTAGVGMTGCGSSSSTSVSSMLSSIQVTLSQQNGDLWAQMSAEIDTGGMILDSVNVPVVDPNNPSIVYGNIDLQSTLCPATGVCTGGGTLSISVDISQISNVQMTSDTLPNGTLIPVGTTASAAIVALPIGSSGAKLYVGLGQGVALLGVAMPFSALNSVGEYVPGVDIFQPFSLGGVSGEVGLFTGSAADTTGLGLFVDLSSLINTSPTPTPSASPVVVAAANVEMNSLASADEKALEAAKPLKLKAVQPSSSEEEAVYDQLGQLSNRGVHLRFQ